MPYFSGMGAQKFIGMFCAAFIHLTWSFPFLYFQVSAFTKVEREAQRLREENEILAAQVTAFTERPAADGRENGDSPYKEEKKQNINVEFINNETQ